MTTHTRQGYNPCHAGNVLMKQCHVARKTLLSKLQRPDIKDVAAFEAYTLEKVRICQLDYTGLRSELKNSPQ